MVYYSSMYPSYRLTDEDGAESDAAFITAAANTNCHQDDAEGQVQ